MATAWIRKLKITLMSETSHKQIIFGDSAEYARLTNAYAEDPTIKVTGTKYLSPLKDEFIVYIKNVPMQADDTIADVASVSEIKEGNYRYITIESGYQDASMVIFNGYIVFISSKREEANKYRVGEIFNPNNFGLANVDWQKRKIRFDIIGIDGKSANGFEVNLK